jgi:O-antigen ligase
VEESDETEFEGSTQARLDTWNTILRLSAEHPIEGVGFGGLGYVLRVTGERLGLEHIKDSPHSTFLRVLGEMGVIGLAVYVLLLWKCWALARDGLRVARDRFERSLAVALGAATVVVAVNCWFGDRFFEFDIMCGFWILAAVVDDVVYRAKVARA